MALQIAETLKDCVRFANFAEAKTATWKAKHRFDGGCLPGKMTWTVKVCCKIRKKNEAIRSQWLFCFNPCEFFECLPMLPYEN